MENRLDLKACLKVFNGVQTHGEKKVSNIIAKDLLHGLTLTATPAFCSLSKPL